MTEKNNIYIEDVVDVKELQTLQDNWAKATDLAFVTVDCNGTPITKQSNFTPFCKRLRELDAFREKCYYCDACGGRKARRIGKAYVYICHAGLIDFAIPIMIKGQYVGAFLAGQVTSTDFADLKKITTQSEDWKDNQELVELYSQVKEVSVEKIEAVAQIICDSYNYSVEREYANKVNAELREKDYKLMKEEKLRIEMEKSLRDIELKALHYQINPHFIYNTLSVFSGYASQNGQDTLAESIASFGQILRYNIKNDSLYASIDSELHCAYSLINVYNIRYFNQIQLTVDVPPALKQFRIIKFLLQPLLENSILHGLDQPGTSLDIFLSICLTDDFLDIELSDNGKGMSPERLAEVLNYMQHPSEELPASSKGSFIGLQNIYRRLKLFYGQSAQLYIESEEQCGTMITLHFPAIFSETAGNLQS